MNQTTKRLGALGLSCLFFAGAVPVRALPWNAPDALRTEDGTAVQTTETADTYAAPLPDTGGDGIPAEEQAVTTLGPDAADSAPVSRAAGNSVPVSLSGREVAGGGAKLVSGLTYIPLRTFVGEITGGTAKVTWNAGNRTATVRTDTLTLYAGEGDIYLSANDRYFYTEGAILNLGGTLYVPLRPVARAFGLSVAWNAQSRSVALTGNARTYVLPGADKVYDADEVYWLSRIISAESRGEPMKGQIAVGNVVGNRVASKEFPDSIYGVIFDRKHGTQFSPVASGTIYKTPAASSVIAAKICLEGYSVSKQALYFFNPKLATSFWISKNCTYLFTIGTHRFYK